MKRELIAFGVGVVLAGVFVVLNHYGACWLIAY
jgi:hypothetical protein